MRRSILVATATAILVVATGSMSAVAMIALPQVLPAVGAEGRTLALTVDQLNPEERALFGQLAPGSADARRFLFTRGYLRYAREVVDGRRAPLDLPALPARDNWNRDFLSPDEATGILDVALRMKFNQRTQGAAGRIPRPPAVLVDPADQLPEVNADRMIGPLTADQLYPEERETFATLNPESAEARRYLYTRGFLRFCRLVLDGQLAPLDLPRLPIRDNWDRGFLSEDEATNILDVALGMKFAEWVAPAS